jgi:3-oxoacyl-[acyl-carrier protein] reductase
MTDAPVVLITGTSRGIGYHLAEHFAGRGWSVVGCSRTADAGPNDQQYEHRELDLTSEQDVVALFQFLRERHGRVDAVVNSAATNPTRSLVALTAGSAAAATLSANVLAPFLVCRESVKLMMRRGSGRIVNIGSMATRHEVAGEALYTASKAALIALTRVLAKEVAQHGITCNVVAPAAVAGGIAADIDPVKLQAVLDRNAVPRVGTPEEVAEVVEWLVGPHGGAVTGQVVYLGGA